MKRVAARSQESVPLIGRQREGAIVDLDDLKRPRDATAAKGEDLITWPRPVVPAPRTGLTSPLVPVPHEITGIIVGASIRQLSEHLAPSASVDKSCRLAIGGYRQQDGASSLAAAIAIDLNQRLSINTVLVDANLRNPSLHRLLAPNDRRNAQVMLDDALQPRNTAWRRLSLVSCALQNDDAIAAGSPACLRRLAGVTQEKEKETQCE